MSELLKTGVSISSDIVGSTVGIGKSKTLVHDVVFLFPIEIQDVSLAICCLCEGQGPALSAS